MSLTHKGKAIEASMEGEYGKKKGEQVFYASKNKGTIKGVDKGSYDKGVDRKKRDVARKMHGTMKSNYSGKNYKL